MISPRDKEAVIIPIDAHNADVALHAFCKRAVPELAWEFVAIQSYETVIVRRIKLLQQSYEDVADAVWNEVPKGYY
jgi:hypothetical protein